MHGINGHGTNEKNRYVCIASTNYPVNHNFVSEYEENSAHSPKNAIVTSNVISLASNKINVRIDKLIAVCLLDTGAQISIIKRYFFDKLPENIKQRTIPSDIQFCTVANNQKSRIELKIMLSFEINKVNYESTFYILENTIEDLILGMDFLSSHLAQIDLAENTITLSNQIPHGAITNEKTRLSLIQALTPTYTSDTSHSSINILQAESLDNNYDRLDRTQNTLIHSIQQTAQEIEENVKLLDLSESDLCDNEKDIVRKLFREHGEVMSSKPSQLGCLRAYKYDLNLSCDTKVIRTPPYRIDLNEKNTMKNEINKLVESGVIFKSMSKWSHPCFLVKKKNTDEKRLVVNMKMLNKHIDVPTYHTPNVEDLMAILGTQKPIYYSKFDIRSAYFQLMLTKRASEICSFSTFMGIYSYARAPMGLSDLPGIFQNIISEIVGDMDNIFTYMDDILVFTSDFNTHVNVIRELLQRFLKAGLTISPNKTQIAVKEIEFLGFIISKNGVQNSPQNLSKIINVELPRTTKELKRVLGLFSYVRRYVKDHSKIACILYEQLKGNKNVKLIWTSEMREAFHKLKRAIQEAPPLGFIDLKSEYPVTLVSDSSSRAIGYYLYQMQPNSVTNKLEKRYLFFGGMNLHPVAQRWPIWKSELYAVLMATKRLEQYLKPKKFY